MEKILSSNVDDTQKILLGKKFSHYIGLLDEPNDINEFNLEKKPPKTINLKYKKANEFLIALWNSKKNIEREKGTEGYNNFILNGNPGTGKTTLAKYLAKLCCFCWCFYQK